MYKTKINVFFILNHAYLIFRIYTMHEFNLISYFYIYYLCILIAIQYLIGAFHFEDMPKYLKYRPTAKAAKKCKLKKSKLPNEKQENRTLICDNFVREFNQLILKISTNITEFQILAIDVLIILIVFVGKRFEYFCFVYQRRFKRKFFPKRHKEKVNF